MYGPYKSAKGKVSLIDRIWCKYISPESNAIYLVRQKQFYENTNDKIKNILARFIHVKLMRRYGIHINKGTIIGIGLRIAHPSSIVITECTIGENFTIYQNCTIGQKSWHSGLMPTIGNNVTMCAGSSIIGKIVVADDVIIGANACLVKGADTPGTYVGVPARKI